MLLLIKKKKKKNLIMLFAKCCNHKAEIFFLWPHSHFTDPSDSLWAEAKATLSFYCLLSLMMHKIGNESIVYTRNNWRYLKTKW